MIYKRCQNFCIFCLPKLFICWYFGVVVVVVLIFGFFWWFVLFVFFLFYLGFFVVVLGAFYVFEDFCV